MDTKGRLKELKRLAGETSRHRADAAAIGVKAGEVYHRRAVLAREVLADHDWIVTEFNGDDDKARKAIEDGYFADLSGAISVTELHEILGEFESVDQWREAGFNLTALLAMAREAKRARRTTERGEPTTRRSVTVKEHEAIVEQLTESKAIAKIANDRLSEVERENVRLRDENRHLQRELAKQEGRIVELERLLERSTSRV